MNLNNVTFPYPILGSYDDFISDICKTEYEKPIRKDKENYYFVVDLSYHNDEIRQLVEGEGDLADYVCEVTCDATRYRQCYKKKETHFEITVPRRAVGGDIVLTFTVVAKKDILNYSNSQFNPDYEGHFFNLHPGDLLAIFPQIKCPADIKYDKLKAVGSYMEIYPTEKDTPYVDLGWDKIRLYLPKPLYDLYQHNGNINTKEEILHASLVMNALTYALCNFDENRDRKWARTVQYRIDTEEEFEEFKGLEPNEWPQVDKLAHILLGKPYERLFSYLISNQD